MNGASAIDPLERDDVLELLEGSADLHIHSGPDLVARSDDDAGFAAEAAKFKMSAIAVKSHFESTAARARIAHQNCPDVRVVGMVPLNHAMGGLNPTAVDVAGRMGARIVMMPTIDARNEREFKHPADAPPPIWSAAVRDLEELGIVRPPISIVDETGQLSVSAREIIDVAHAHEMTIASGHVGSAELLALARAGRDRGVRVIATHPEFPSTRLTLEMQRELIELGVRFERCFGMYTLGKADWDELFATLRELGTDSTQFSTDLGQRNRPRPVAGLADGIARLLDAGFSAGDLRRTLTDNAAEIVG